MAVPKRRNSKARTNSRRSQWKIAAAATQVCPQCREPKLPHRACPNCGTYKGREVIEVEAN
ncbi:MAG: 50S ribosomal protein L32 [Firmicutes bacterium]|nr:50S ribosomal protein L32 [Bacillota bacterium]